MRSTCLASNSRILALVGFGLLVGSCTPTYDSIAPFRCELSADCPEGYHCNTRLCVRDGVAEPVPITTTVADDAFAFSVHPRATGDVLVCWRQALAARDPGIHAAVLGANGAVTTPEAPLYSDDANSVAIVAPIAGDCAPLNNEKVVVTTRLAGTEQYLARVFAVGDQARPAASQTFHRHGFNYYSIANVGNEIWAIDSRNSNGGDDSRLWFLTRINQAYEMSTARLWMPPFSAQREIVTTAVRSGTNGAWMAGIFRDGSAEFAFYRPTITYTALPYIVQPVTQYREAYPLAVRGDNLAIGYRLSGNHWQIYWIEPGQGDSTTDPVTATPGPAFDLAEGVALPGAYADGDRLILAGALPDDQLLAGESHESGHVEVWTAPWGSATPLEHLETIDKLSRIVPRRLAVTAVAGRLQVVWTERVPAFNEGSAQYVSLNAAALRAPASTP